jgi:predicted glycosyltransferase
MYSHDTFGLGHIRRSRAIANALVARHPDVSILIISGSPVIGNFDFGNGIDYVRVPGVVKLPDGDYTSLNLNLDIEEAVRIRETLILSAAESFRPDLFIVDKEPTGFRGECLRTLAMLRKAGCRLVLGVRDVMDEPAFLVPEWQRKGAGAALAEFYDEVWVYGLKEIYEPLAALDLPDRVHASTHYTGYIGRSLPSESQLARYPKLTRKPFLLVTTGGGGDGDGLVDWVIDAYEAEGRDLTPALIVFGPFIERAKRRDFHDRISRLPMLDAIAFDAKIEHLMHRAEAIVAMGGYNTFCEILSFDKRALIVPRVKPRLEQFIRADAAERLGLAAMLVDPAETGGTHDPHAMARAIRMLPQRRRPSEVMLPGLLDGLDNICALSAPWIASGHGAASRQPPAALGQAAE